MRLRSKISLINDILSGKDLEKIKEIHKVNNTIHDIKQNIKQRNDLIKKMNLDDDLDLYKSYDIVLLNNKINQFVIDNNIRYRSLDSVIYRIDSQDELYDENIADYVNDKSLKLLKEKSHHMSVYAIINDINNKVFIGITSNIKRTFIKLMNYKMESYNIKKLIDEITETGKKHFYVIEIEKFSYSNKRERNKKKIYYINLFDTTNIRDGGLNMKNISKKTRDMFKDILQLEDLF